MYGHEGIFSGEGGGKVVNVVCLFSSLGCDKHV